MDEITFNYMDKSYTVVYRNDGEICDIFRFESEFDFEGTRLNMSDLDYELNYIIDFKIREQLGGYYEVI